ncbi:MAG: hypothetical protein RL607_258 [Bacteroidota bacterium]
MPSLVYYRVLFALVQMGALNSHYGTLPFYVFVFWLAFEGLNANATYANLPFTKYTNSAFLLLPITVVLIRNHWVPYYLEGILWYNIFEHLLFAFTLCLYLDCLFLCWKHSIPTTRWVLQLFNGIGVVNECFQNGYGNEPVFQFSVEDWKDLGVNMAGSILFFSVKQILKRIKK